MSDSIPIIVHVLPENNLTRRFGSEIGDFLKNNNQINKIYNLGNEFREGATSEDERRFEASSRNGMMIYALGELIDKAKLKNLDFISDKTYTHEIVLTAYDLKEIFRVSVINKDFDKIVEDITKLIEWSRENTEEIPEELLWSYGQDRDGREFDTKIEAIDNVPPSLNPNDNICDADSNSLALAFSVLKTIRELLLYAKEMDYLVIVEHWGGFE